MLRGNEYVLLRLIIVFYSGLRSPLVIYFVLH